MPFIDDPWIEKNSIIDPERLHALGVVTVFWNHSERMLFFLFCFVCKFTPKFGWVIAHDMGAISLIERITELLKIRPLANDEQELLVNALKIYEICRQNRNLLTHFTVNRSKEADDEFVFLRTKGPSAAPKQFPSSLEDIRRVAFEIQTFSVYLHKIWKALIHREVDKSTPLPPIIALPELLWKPPLPTDANTQLQQKSFQESQHEARPPSTLRLTREEWAAKDAKDARSAAEEPEENQE
jgi:hypothetical protein